MRISIALQGSVNETAVTKLPDHPGLKEETRTWFSHDDPRWFERGDIFHSCGVVLDKTTKVVVAGDGKRIDSFRIVDFPDLFRVTRCTGNSCGDGVAGVLAMEISRGEMLFEGEGEEYDRARLSFEAVRVGGYNAFAKNAEESSAQYYLVDGVAGFGLSGVTKCEFSEVLMVARGVPFRHPTEPKYDPALALRFRKTFLG